MHLYVPKLRPPTTVNLPRGEWTLVERPYPGLGFDRRVDLPASTYRFGVVGYEEKLNDEQVEHFDLEYLGEKEIKTDGESS
jgi:hypothetical protein